MTYLLQGKGTELVMFDQSYYMKATCQNLYHGMTIAHSRNQLLEEEPCLLRVSSNQWMQ